MKPTPYECYTIYLALKQHFSNDKYDFFLYKGKVRTSVSAYNKRNDRYFFEKLSRKFNKQEIIEYFVSSFIKESDPSNLWIGDLREQGDTNYAHWKARTQALPYKFQEELKTLSESTHLYECIKFEGTKHPPIIKSFLKDEISLETLFIVSDILQFIPDTEYDPIIKIINFKIKKYRPFFEYNKQYFIEQIQKIYVNQ